MSHRRPSQRASVQLSPSMQRLLVAGLLIIALLGMVVWNINLRSDKHELEASLEASRGENSTLRQSANATVFQLLPTSDGPPAANGQVWLSVQGSGVLSVANLPSPEAGRMYQLWYITDAPNEPVPGGTFKVDGNGQGFMLIPSDVEGITSIGISLEPEGGSAKPSSPILLSSDISDARG